MKTVKVTITGRTPLLMHADNIEWADRMEAWKNDPKNRAKSKAGDDRTPPFRWIGCLNYDDPKTGVVTIPLEYLKRSMMGGAARVPTGKGKGTFKALSQSGITCQELHWPLLVRGKSISMKDINECLELDTFLDHVEAANVMGFSLFTKRAKIGSSKHIRVRPRFDDWSTQGELVILDDQIKVTTVEEILEYAGRTQGLGDWRPGCATPGPFGMFEAKVN